VDKEPSTDYAAQLTADLWERIRAQPVTGARPRRAATLMLIDHIGAEKPKVLMGRRHDGHKFMPGKFVFPGGRVERCDLSMNVAGMLEPVTEAKLLAALGSDSPSVARATALAAIRETFEETGVIVGSQDYGTPERAPEGPWARYASAGVFPVPEELHFVGRAITPPRNKMRFDAFFFAADISAVAGMVEGVVGPDSELVELVWVEFAEALALGLPLITSVILRELEDRLAKGMSRFLPVPFYRTTRTGWVRDLL
jgi:8-oxo-dGTP pyrophosphatase MutT (NUDIX family)